MSPSTFPQVQGGEGGGGRAVSGERRVWGEERGMTHWGNTAQLSSTHKEWEGREILDQYYICIKIFHRNPSRFKSFGR